jgi:predicted nucleic acid-binding protein
VRIVSHPGYPSAHAVHDIVRKLHRASQDPVHEFWADDVSVLDDRLIDTTRVHGPRQLTDVYLLALAVSHGGVLVTFDRSIAVDAVRGATVASLVVL